MAKNDRGPATGPEMRLAVLHIVASVGPRAGGIAAYIGSVRAALGERTMEMRLAAQHEEPEPRPDAPLAYARRLWLEVGAADVVHVHGLFNWPFVLGALISRLRRKPYIVSVHGALLPWRRPDQPKKRLFLRTIGIALLRRAREIVATTALDAGALRTLHPQLRVVAIAPGISLPPRLPRRATSSGGALKMIFVGRLQPVKGLPVLLEALPLITISEVQLDIVGDGPPEHLAELRAIVARLGLDSRITFHGFVDGPPKEALLRDSDVFVLPSYSENFSFATAEALAQGLPVVVSEAVGLAETVRRYDCGRVVAPGSAPSLAQALRELAEPSVRERCAENARLCAEQEFSLESMGRALLRLYRPGSARAGRTV